MGVSTRRSPSLQPFLPAVVSSVPGLFLNLMMPRSKRPACFSSGVAPAELRTKIPAGTSCSTSTGKTLFGRLTQHVDNRALAPQPIPKAGAHPQLLPSLSLQHRPVRPPSLLLKRSRFPICHWCRWSPCQLRPRWLAALGSLPWRLVSWRSWVLPCGKGSFSTQSFARRSEH